MEPSTFKWRILRQLSNCAFVVLMIAYVLGWYHLSQLDDSVMNNPTVTAPWLVRRNLYDRIGITSAAIMVILRVSYWVIEYFYDRRTIARGGSQ